MAELRTGDKRLNAKTTYQVTIRSRTLADGRVVLDHMAGATRVAYDVLSRAEFDALSLPTLERTPADMVWTLVKEWTFDAGATLSGLNVYDGFKTSGNTVGGLYKRSNVRLGDGELMIVGDGVNGGGLNVMLWRTYGRWEVRARMDAGSGAGPCLLLWPQSDVWPRDGEIDFMESPFGDHMEVDVTTHWGTWPTHLFDQGKFGSIDAKQWHVYAVEWESGVIRYYIDGTLVRTKTGTPGVDIPNKSMSLAMQVDGPNGWIPKRDATSPAEMAFHIDYARVYSR